MNNERINQIALTLVPGIGPVQAKQLVEYFGDATSIFKAKKKELSRNLSHKLSKKNQIMSKTI